MPVKGHDLPPEHRGYIRLSKKVDVWFKITDEKEKKDATRKVFHCYSENMGGGGIFLTCPPMAEVRREKLLSGEYRLAMKINLPGAKTGIRATGRVVWLNDLDNGMVGIGAEFLEMAKEDREKILSFVMGRFHF